MAMSLTFGGHRFDLGTRQLFRGSSELHLSPKAFELLRLLVEHRTRALSKAELQDQLWPGTFVTEANLPSLVAELRRALDDEPRTPKFIRTVHGFGYAFCGQISGGGDAVPSGHTCWVVLNGREIPLNDGENIIGRDADAAVRIEAPSVSRRHARILVATAGVTLEDLGSKNGTLVWQERVTAPVSLVDRDELQVGSIRMTLRMRGDASGTQTVDT